MATTETTRQNPIAVSLVTVALVALGVALLVRYRPTPDFWSNYRIGDHLLGLSALLLVGLASGWFWTRSALQTFLICMGLLFASAGLFFYANGSLDNGPPRVLHYEILAKDSTYSQGSENEMDYTLLGRTPQGHSFRFAVQSNHLTHSEWRSARPLSGDYILVHEHPGALGVPWWKIEGLRARQPIQP